MIGAKIAVDALRSVLISEEQTVKNKYAKTTCLSNNKWFFVVSLNTIYVKLYNKMNHHLHVSKNDNLLNNVLR